MEKKILREKDGRFCQIEFRLNEGRFTVVGTEGRIITKAAAKKEALAYWVSFFEESPDEIIDMNKRFGKRFTSATGAAKFVLEQDGELHGLDVFKEGYCTVYLTESCGQIRERQRPFERADQRAPCPSSNLAVQAL